LLFEGAYEERWERMLIMLFRGMGKLTLAITKAYFPERHPGLCDLSELSLTWCSTALLCFVFIF